eukprot:s813_g10.t1
MRNPGGFRKRRWFLQMATDLHALLRHAVQQGSFPEWCFNLFGGECSMECRRHSFTRMEREFCGDHAHLHEHHQWYNGLEPQQAAGLVNVSFKDEKEYLLRIEELATASCAAGFTLPAVSRETRALAGYVHATFDSETLKIQQCKVDRPHQGKGLGGLLLQAAEERARNLGASFCKVKLCVLDSNEPAKKCYTKAGFKVCSSRPSKFPPCSCGDGPCGHQKMKWLDMQKCWNLFDSFLVVSSVLDVILTYTAAEISPALAASMKMLKLFRIMRVFRVFRFFRELGNWAMMIIDSLKSLFGALILLGIIVYVFAVSLSMNTADWLIQQESAGMVDRMLYEDVETWFGSLGSTVYTLMLSILGGVSWHIVCDLLFRIDILSACMLLFYIMFTIFSVLNVITGVFVDSAIQTTNSQRDIQIERELELKDSFLKSLKDFFEALDTDGNGAIHLDEIKIMLQDQTLAAYFAVLGFDEVNAHQIFHLLDDDESGEVSIQEFLDGCAKLKGQARSIDVHAIMHQYRALHRDISFVGSQLGVDLHQAAHASRQSHWFGRQTQTSVLQANSKRLSTAA